MATGIKKNWPQAEEEIDCLFCRKSRTLPPQGVPPRLRFGLWKRSAKKTSQTEEEIEEAR